MAVGRDRQNRKAFPYPSPYMDIAGTWYPSSVKDLFRWCKYYFYSNPVVQSIIYKLAEYPITDFIYETEGEGELTATSKKKIKRMTEIVLDLKSFLLEVGLDYFTYGNAFISINLPFKRKLICPSCNEAYDIKDVDYKLKKYKFIINCNKCGAINQEAKVDDKTVNDPSLLNLVRWNPENIQIDYNPITGRSEYYYRIPNRIRNDIIRGKKIVIEETPYTLLQALSENKDLKLQPKNLFHYKRPTLAEEDMGWGKPIVLSIMKDIFYLQTLKKGNEAICLQHIVPLDVLFPTQNGSMDPYTHTNLSLWKSKIEDEIRKWRNDPNYISIMPVPVGMSRIGGDGRMLLVTPEVESTLKNIAAGLGVPLEFVFGGLNWSGSSVSLRTLENHFLTTRQQHHKFLLWLFDRIKQPLNLPKSLEVRMVEFKMADDVQQKQLVMNLNQAGKISDETVLTEFGFDYDDEVKRRTYEIDKQNEVMKKSTIANAVANGEAQKIQMNYQMEINDLQKKKAEEEMRKSNRSADLANVQMGGAPAMPQPQQPNTAQPGSTIPNQQQGAAAPENTMPMEMDWTAEAQNIAQKANALTPEQKAEFLARLKKETPELYNIVKEYMDTGDVSRGKNVVNMNPLPEQKPPRRAGEV